MIHGVAPQISLALVEHRLTKAVGFTGSLSVGRALFDAASRRIEPIPVFAEMGSLNPVFILPGALEEKGELFAKELVHSVLLGNGQFCTKPGLVFGISGKRMSQMIESVSRMIEQVQPATMLNAHILQSFNSRLDKISRMKGGVYMLLPVKPG